MTELIRKKGENFESFFRRFSQEVLRLGTRQIVREKQYNQPKINKAKRKKKALYGRRIRRDHEYMVRIGKIKERTNNMQKKR